MVTGQKDGERRNMNKIKSKNFFLPDLFLRELDKNVGVYSHLDKDKRIERARKNREYSRKRREMIKKENQDE